MRGQQVKLASQFMRKSKEFGYIMPAESFIGGETTQYVGAFVIDLEKSYYEHPIATLDFASLYPSIKMTYRMCYCTLLIQYMVSQAHKQANYQVQKYHHQLLVIEKIIKQKVLQLYQFKMNIQMMYRQFMGTLIQLWYILLQVAEVMQSGLEAANMITKCFPPPINLEFEKSLSSISIIKRKRYADLLWAKPDKWEKDNFIQLKNDYANFKFIKCMKDGYQSKLNLN